ncbi:MAG: GYD domain-containing protein [Vulcanimicrobiaceae bacterium]
MATYVILSRFAHDACADLKAFKDLAKTVSDKIKAECPNVTWKDSYAATGRFDIVDIVDSPDLAGIERAAMIIRCYGHATTETLVATPWTEFISTLATSPGAAAART